MKPFKIMGIVNLTPDSFSDGGAFYDKKKAVKHIFSLIEYGADIIDLGAESTRPFAKEVSAKEEWERLEPVLSFLLNEKLPCKISVDTRKPELMERSANLGAHMINSVSGVPEDQTLLNQLSKCDVDFVAMHMHKKPQDMQNAPLKGNSIISTMDQFFKNSQEKLIESGFKPEKIWLDPGIGFGKNDDANLTLLANTNHFSKKYNLLLGVSRKAFFGRQLGIDEPKERDHVSNVLEFGLYCAGAKILRTHNVSTLARLRSCVKLLDNS